METLGIRDSQCSDGPILTRQTVLRAGAGGLLAFMAGMKIKAAQADAGLKIGFLLPDFDQLRWRNGDFAGFEMDGGITCKAA
jgi:hypothetical protein